MTARNEYDAAYFTLLRAIEERDNLLRYREFLYREGERLDEFAEETRAVADEVVPKTRRAVDQTTRQLLEAVGRRRAVVQDELRRVGDRIANAEAFVEECEIDVQRLRG